MARRYTERDVLDYLDNCVAYYPKCFFMDLEYPYFYSVNSRLSLFADDANWAIAFEESGYANQAFEIKLALNSTTRHLPAGDARALTPAPGSSIVSERVHLIRRGADVGAGIDAEGGEDAGEDLRGGALAVFGEGLREGDDA